MILQVIDTTDNQWLGLTRPVPDPWLLQGQHIQVEADIWFRIDKVEDLGAGTWRFSNPGYVVRAQEVGA